MYPTGGTCRPGIEVIRGVALLVKLTMFLADSHTLDKGTNAEMFFKSLLLKIFSDDCSACQIAAYRVKGHQILIEAGIMISAMCSERVVVDSLNKLNASSDPFIVNSNGNIKIAFSVIAVYKTPAKSSSLYVSNSVCERIQLVPVTTEWLVTCPHVALEINQLRQTGINNQTLHVMITQSFSKDNGKLAICIDNYISTYSRTVIISTDVQLTVVNLVVWWLEQCLFCSYW